MTYRLAHSSRYLTEAELWRLLYQPSLSATALHALLGAATARGMCQEGFVPDIIPLDEDVRF